MPNYAYYEMKVLGKQDNVEAFIRAMKWEGEYQEHGVGRVSYCEVYEKGESDDGYYACLSGDCAWSILSAMRLKDNPNNLEKLSEKLNLFVEAYSEEPGCAFQEHFLVKNGKIEIDECVEFEEITLDELEDVNDEFWSHYGSKYGLTKENASDFAIDDIIRLGGYKAWDFYI